MGDAVWRGYERAIEEDEIVPRLSCGPPVKDGTVALSVAAEAHEGIRASIPAHGGEDGPTPTIGFGHRTIREQPKIGAEPGHAPHGVGRGGFLADHDDVP